MRSESSEALSGVRVWKRTAGNFVTDGIQLGGATDGVRLGGATDVIWLGVVTGDA